MQTDVIIPVYRPGKDFGELLRILLLQTVRPGKIILMITEEEEGDAMRFSGWLEDWQSTLRIAGSGTVEMIVCGVKKEAFDHGGTRHLGAMKSDAEYLLFMTQDAIPADCRLIEKLLGAIGQDAAAYARQLAREDAGLIEAYTRIFNYPSNSERKTEEDVKTKGIKAYFCSNVCAIYRRDIYFELGGFEKQIVFGEDMLFAAKLLKAGYAVVYAAEAKVIHSHNDSCRSLFKRNFDMGAAQADHPEVYASLPPEKEGLRLVKQTFDFLTDRRAYWLAATLLIQSALKYAGYLLGRHYSFVPVPLLFGLTANSAYWKRRGFGCAGRRSSGRNGNDQEERPVGHE